MRRRRRRQESSSGIKTLSGVFLFASCPFYSVGGTEECLRMKKKKNGLLTVSDLFIGVVLFLLAIMCMLLFLCNVFDEVTYILMSHF